jgi:hypothetical protein
MLLYLAILASSNSEDVMLALQTLFAREDSSYKILRYARRFFWNPIIEIAIISNVSHDPSQKDN